MLPRNAYAFAETVRSKNCIQEHTGEIKRQAKGQISDNMVNFS